MTGWMVGSFIEIGKLGGKQVTRRIQNVGFGHFKFHISIRYPKVKSSGSWTSVDRSRDTSLLRISEKVRYIFYFCNFYSSCNAFKLLGIRMRLMFMIRINHYNILIE